MLIVSRVKALAESLLIRAISETRPMAVQLDITNACNLSCSHCYHPHHNNQGSLSLADWFQLLERIREFMEKFRLTPTFIICGGEPMISPFLKPVVERIVEMWKTPHIALLTNGTVHRKSTLDFLVQHKARFQVSLDGPDADRHDVVRGPGSFQKSVTGIRKMKEAGAEVSVLSILSARTKPWIADFFKLAKELEVDSQNFTRLIAQGNGQKLVQSHEDSPLEKLELKQALENILIHSIISGIPTNTDQPLYALVDSRLGKSGYFAYDSLIIDYKGNLKATSRADLVLGNLKENTIEELYMDNIVMRKVRNKDIEQCGDCNLYDQCGGDRNAAFAAFGDFTARDPGCWKSPT